MEIIRAAHSGFCFGVKQAIKAAEHAALEHPNRRVFTCGALIHNDSVTDDLKEKGIQIIHSLEEVDPEDIVIIRSHGEGKGFYEDAKGRGLILIDATCPFVARIHEIVKNAHQQGETILIAGNPDHPEVIGINGWCENTAVVMQGPEDAMAFAEEALQKDPSNESSRPALIVSQTTLEEETFFSIIETLQEHGIALRIENTICHATKNRQQAARELSQEVDAMIVIGGKNSSNTKKLYNICKKNLEKTFFVENYSNLSLKEFQKCNKIGLTAGASTPERDIKEVISAMSEIITNENNNVMPDSNVETSAPETMVGEITSMEEAMAGIEDALRLPRVGDIKEGTVEYVNDDEVIVNMGVKKDGILRANEVTLEEGQKLTDLFHRGDKIEAKVIKTDDSEGGILLSKKKLEANVHWKELEAALEDNTTVEVKVVKVVKGGVLASYKEVTGFIPLSLLSDKYVEADTADSYVGQVFPVKVTKIDQRRGNGRIVFSHKTVLREEREKQQDEIWENLHVDDVVEGTVKRFTDYGAFVDLGGIDGLLHISEISWGKLKHPDEVLKIEQTVKVKILSMNREKGKISLGLKQTTPEPWSVIEDNYKVGQIVQGKVVQTKEYGAFVELEPGLDGLVHISEVANKHVQDIKAELEIGQEVSAKILDIDTERKRISLSIKEALDEEAPVEE